MILREATMKDAPFILEARNDPQTIAASYYANEVTLEEHHEWLANCLDDNKITILIAEVDEPVGVFRVSNGVCSWMVHPKHRGMGYGKRLVKAACGLIKRRPLIALIHDNNAASLALAHHAGFKHQRNYDGDWGYYTMEASQ